VDSATQSPASRLDSSLRLALNAEIAGWRGHRQSRRPPEQRQGRRKESGRGHQSVRTDER
jgi:hypothetical protein